MNEIPKGRIVFLDYMRVFAFISVLVGHKYFGKLASTAASTDTHITIRLIAEALMPLCYGGAAGVIVFFLTSGYIITHVLQTECARDFLIKRIFRIYPLYIFAVIMELIFDFAFREIPLPPLSVIIPRILLIGDFFSTPYGLNGVEWTLRIEIMFYLFMCILKGAGAFNRQSLLPYIYGVASLALYYSHKMPTGLGTDGYFNIYAPFLFIGSCIYLFESKKAHRPKILICLTLIAALFLSLIPKIQPEWKDSNYAAFAILIFISAFLLKKHLADSKQLIMLSELTYSVYLFHNWLWDYIYNFFKDHNIHLLGTKAQTLIVLLVFCYAMNKTVEKLGIQAGRSVLKFMKQRGKATDEKKIAPVASSRLT
jgi:peptidoglycan/LPS O-acetylase OafA/YrhL